MVAFVFELGQEEEEEERKATIFKFFIQSILFEQLNCSLIQWRVEFQVRQNSLHYHYKKNLEAETVESVADRWLKPK